MNDGLQKRIDSKRKNPRRTGRGWALTSEQIDEVRSRYVEEDSASCATLADEFGVSKSTVWRALKRG